MYKPMCVCLFCAKSVPLEKTEEAFAQHEPNCEWVKHTRTNWEHWHGPERNDSNEVKGIG
jgi:hypothetical protein